MHNRRVNELDMVSRLNVLNVQAVIITYKDCSLTSVASVFIIFRSCLRPFITRVPHSVSICGTDLMTTQIGPAKRAVMPTA